MRPERWPVAPRMPSGHRLDEYRVPGYDPGYCGGMRVTNLYLELYLEYVIETGERSVPHMRGQKMVAVVHSFEEAEEEAAQHAGDENYGDGDYHVKNAEGRRVAGVAVRSGFASLTHETPGPTAGESLEALARPCAFCAVRMILIPCQACGLRRCANCVGRRVCCSPPA